MTRRPEKQQRGGVGAGLGAGPWKGRGPRRAGPQAGAVEVLAS